MSVVTLVLLCLCSVSFAFQSVSVNTNVGQFNGLRRTFEAFGEPRSVDKYLGIPYAEPPTGERRWQKPTPKDVLTEPYDAAGFGSACLPLEMPMGGARKSTLTISFSEDCLFLNVFVPSGAQQPQPVMVYFHGGGYNVGASDFHVADTFSAVGNVIFVTVNYRLNIWGFLSTGDDNIPGNFGLWDQHLALRWVHDNIAAFGGDKHRVTMTGHSAGAGSTIYHSMYPANKGLFQRTYALAGSITCPWAFNPNPLKVTKHFADLAGCTGLDTTKQLATCLRSKTSEELYAVLNKPEHAFVKFPLEFLPVIDNALITETPEIILSGTSDSLIRQKLFNSIDFMTGTNDMEGLMNISPFVGAPDFEGFTVTREEFEKVLVPEAIRIGYGDNVPDIVRELVIHRYTDWSDPNDPVKARQKWLEMTSDYVFKTHTKKVAELHAKYSNKNTYLYNSDAFPSQHILPTPTWANKPNHGDELTFLYGYDQEGFTMWTMPFTEDFTPPQWELDLSKAFMTMISNFAKSGNPNEPIDIQYFTKSRWPAYNMETQLAFNISREMSADSVVRGLYGRATHFWNTLIPSVIQAYGHAHSPSSPFVPRDDKSCDADGNCNP